PHPPFVAPARDVGAGSRRDLRAPIPTPPADATSRSPRNHARVRDKRAPDLSELRLLTQRETRPPDAGRRRSSWMSDRLTALVLGTEAGDPNAIRLLCRETNPTDLRPRQQPSLG